jgi:predicted TIM-barrel fold metal-dependent hydrolase
MTNSCTPSTPSAWNWACPSSFDFPELVLVTRHGCEPWTDLAVKLLLKWPNLYYSTSAFAPKYYPRDILEFANTRGGDKVIYAGYFPMGLSLERIMTEMTGVDLKDDVWPRFLRHNAARVLGLQPAGSQDT